MLAFREAGLCVPCGCSGSSPRSRYYRTCKFSDQPLIQLVQYLHRHTIPFPLTIIYYTTLETCLVSSPHPPHPIPDPAPSFPARCRPVRLDDNPLIGVDCEYLSLLFVSICKIKKSRAASVARKKQAERWNGIIGTLGLACPIQSDPISKRPDLRPHRARHRQPLSFAITTQKQQALVTPIFHRTSRQQPAQGRPSHTSLHTQGTRIRNTTLQQYLHKPSLATAWNAVCLLSTCLLISPPYRSGNTDQADTAPTKTATG